MYGSLYPWHFETRQLTESPLWILLHAWHIDAGRRALADIGVNVALYIPLGMSAHLAWRGWRSHLSLWGPVVLGTVLSASLEMAQIFAPGRQCSAIDLLTNVIGSGLGVAAGIVFERMAGPAGIRRRRVIADRAALALLFCWLGSLLFPIFPATSLPVWRQKIGLFAAVSLSGVIPLVSAAASWFVAGRLMTAAGFRQARVWLTFSVLLVPAQIVIVTRQPSSAEFAGAVAGAWLFCLWGEEGGARAAAWAFLGVLLARGLAPFHLTLVSQEFSWVPFGAFLTMDWQRGIRILLEKVFYYGAAIWLLRRGGQRWRTAAATVAVVLGLIEIAQTHLRGRTPEITDPLLAGLVAFGLWRIAGRAHGDGLI